MNSRQQQPTQRVPGRPAATEQEPAQAGLALWLVQFQLPSQRTA